jgi:hypothetical protein
VLDEAGNRGRRAIDERDRSARHARCHHERSRSTRRASHGACHIHIAWRMHTGFVPRAHAMRARGARASQTPSAGQRGVASGSVNENSAPAPSLLATTI